MLRLRSESLPRLLVDDPTTLFLRLRRRFRAITGRELGFAHATRFLSRFVPKWQQLPVEGPDGAPLFLDLRRKEGYFATGFGQTVGHLAPLLPLVRDGDVVIDVGANVGVWSRALLAHRKLGRIIAFEPVGRNFELLERNLAGHANATAMPFAVGARTGAVKFSTDRDSGQNSVVGDEEAMRAHRSVEMISLDDWAELHRLDRLDLLKVDVEGLEPEVFRGALNLLRRTRPIVYFEFIPGESHTSEAFERLESLGYAVRGITLEGELVGLPSRVSLSNDYIALPTGRESIAGA